MKITKKLTALLLTAALFTFTACSQQAAPASSAGQSSTASGEVSSAPGTSSASASGSRATIRVVGLKGPTGISMVKLMSDADAKQTAEDYQFSLVGSPDEVTAKVISGSVDVAAVPTNLAAVLYNKTQGKVQLAAVTTLGVLYVLTNGATVSGFADLKGKTVYASGQGSTPEYALSYLLKQNGLQAGKDVKVQYLSEHAAVASALIAGKATVAVLPEPFVTQATVKNKNVKVALNLTDEWNKAVGGKSVLTMGCLIVRKDFAEKNADAFSAFLKEYKASAEYANANVDTTATLSQKYGIMDAAVAKKAIPNCSIVFMDGADMKAKVPDFLNVLYQANPKSVGGKLPGDDFYYSK